MRTLVLNAGYEPMQLISWQRAMCLVLTSKAEIVAEYGRAIRSVSECFQMPSVVRLKRYVRLVHRFGVVQCSRRNVFIRDGYECQYCGIHCTPKTATLDHVVPKSKGGPSNWQNLVTSCNECNRKKGNKLLGDSGMALARRPSRPSWQDFIHQSRENAMERSWLPYLRLIA